MVLLLASCNFRLLFVTYRLFDCPGQLVQGHGSLVSLLYHEFDLVKLGDKFLLGVGYLHDLEVLLFREFDRWLYHVEHQATHIRLKTVPIERMRGHCVKGWSAILP